MSDYDAIIRETGLTRAIHTRTMLRQQEAVAVAIDPTGKVTPYAAPKLPPIDYTWGPSSTTRYRVPRATTLVLLAAYATTAPSSGDATVEVTATTETGGTETIATLTIPEDSQFADTIPNVAVPAGAWLYGSVSTANGASGVNISVTLEV